MFNFSFYTVGRYSPHYKKLYPDNSDRLFSYTSLHLKKPCSDCGAHALRHDVEDGLDEADLATEEEAGGDSWVDVTTTDVACKQNDFVAASQKLNVDEIKADWK